MMSSKEVTIRDSLLLFLCEHNAEPAEGAVDDIVLDYVVSILEDLGTEDDVQESFDVEGFSEMMEAYVPGFDSIDNGIVCNWMFKLAENLKSSPPRVDGACSTNGLYAADNLFSQLSLSPPTNGTVTKAVPIRQRKNSHKNSGSASGEESHSWKRESPHVKESLFASGDSTDADMCLLREMFPAASTLELSHCLCVAKGVVDDAIPLILHRQDTGDTIKESIPQAHGVFKPDLNDDQMKESILNKYSYVDTEDDQREHRPSMLLQNKGEKKMIRYLDSKVVSTKGERFTEIKRDDEVDPKKFNINLKPARQYRFH